MNEFNNVLITTLNDSVATIIAFVPRFLSGFIILLIGIILSAIVKRLVEEGLRLVKFENAIKKYDVPESKTRASWTNIISETARWFVIIVFLIPASQVWGLGSFVNVLNSLLLYLPNVFIAALILIVGFVISRLVYDFILASLTGISRKNAKTIAMVSRWAILGFMILIVLNQLGIASELIQILFTGVVAMLAIAGGLAFGLGGKDAAREVIDSVRKKL